MIQFNPNDPLGAAHTALGPVIRKAPDEPPRRPEAGPRGLTGIGITGPRGLTGTGITGPTGPMPSGFTGPTGPTGMGITGPIGPTGVKDSIVATLTHGYRRIAVMEAPMAFVCDLVPANATVRPIMDEIMSDARFRFRSDDGLMDLVLAVRRDLTQWCTPAATAKEYEHHVHNWRVLNGQAKVLTTERE